MTKFTENLKSSLLRHQVLIPAVIVSIMLHALLIAEFSFNLPFPDSDNEDKSLLEARLVKQKPVQPSAPAPAEPSLTKQQPEKPKPEKTTTDTAPIPETESATVNDTATEYLPDTSSSASLDMKPPTGNNHNDVQAEQAGVPEIGTTPEPKKNTYSHVETEFEVRRDVNSSAAGITKIIFVINKSDASYSIHSQTQAKGVASLFFGNLVQKSEGAVTDQGLKPHFYSYQYGNDSKKLQTATFNWDEGLLNLHYNKGERTVSLPEGTQDFLSFMYQFMFSPPLEHMQIVMTNGKKLGTYDYSFEGEEIINSKLGKLSTVHLMRSSIDEEKTEIWLATEYQYLPVRILKTEKNGTVIEQLVVNIRTETGN